MQPSSGSLSFTGEILVKLKTPPGPTPFSIFAPDAVARAAGLEYAQPLAAAAAALAVGTGAPILDDVSRWHVFRVPLGPSPSFVREGEGVSPDDTWDAVRQVLRQPEVEWAEPDAVLTSAGDGAVFAVGTAGDQWNLPQIRAGAAWELVRTKGRAPGEGIVVGHLDTGWTDHPAVPRSRFVSPGLDLVGGGTDARDPMDRSFTANPGHGTGTLCLLAADHATYQGVATGCRILPIRISPSVVHIRTRTMAEGILAAVEGGAEVITISMGGLPSQLWADAVNRAYERGVVICAAAGNNLPLPFGLRSPARVVYPARFDRVLAVSGITRASRRYWFADQMSGNDGPEVDICAPTPDVPWAIAPAAFGPGAGTSTATPQVAGAAAIWLSYYREALAGFSPVEKVEACRRALLVGAAQVPGVEYDASPEAYGRLHNDWFGTGRLDVAGALAQVPVRGLPAQKRATVSWALLKMLGLVSGSAADQDDLADRIQALWNLETGAVTALAREVAVRPARPPRPTTPRIAPPAAAPASASLGAAPRPSFGAAPPPAIAAPQPGGAGGAPRRAISSRGGRTPHLLVVPPPAALALGFGASASGAALGAAAAPSVRSARRSFLEARRFALAGFSHLASRGGGGMALGAAPSGAAAPGVTVLAGIGALVMDEDAADEAALKAIGARVYPNVDVPLVPTPAPLAIAQAETSPWHLHRIGAAAAWTAGIRGKGAVIGVLDTGIDAAHPEFQGKTIHFAEFDAAGRQVDSAEPHDADRHGTHVCGIAAGRTCGAAPDADLAVAAVLTRPTATGVTGTLVQIAAGLDWLVRGAFRGDAGEVGVDVLNMSLGVTPYNTYLYDLLGTARLAGIPAIGAIGNYGRMGRGFCGSPGNYDTVVGVGATDARDQVAAFSDWGTVAESGGTPKPDLCAPGVDVPSALPEGHYGLLSGTSMASPLVAGTVALLLGAGGPLAADGSPPNVQAVVSRLYTLVLAVPTAPKERLGRGLLCLARLQADVAPPPSVGTTTAWTGGGAPDTSTG